MATKSAAMSAPQTIFRRKWNTERGSGLPVLWQSLRTFGASLPPALAVITPRRNTSNKTTMSRLERDRGSGQKDDAVRVI